MGGHLFAVEFRPLENAEGISRLFVFPNDVYQEEEPNGFNNKHIPPYHFL